MTASQKQNIYGHLQENENVDDQKWRKTIKEELEQLHRSWGHPAKSLQTRQNGGP